MDPYHEMMRLYDAIAKQSKEISELRDAVEFEARVAARLATEPLFGCNSKCPWNKMDPKNPFGCIHDYEMRFCRLREARIAVEEKMNEHSQATS